MFRTEPCRPEAIEAPEAAGIPGAASVRTAAAKELWENGPIGLDKNEKALLDSLHTAVPVSSKQAHFPVEQPHPSGRAPGPYDRLRQIVTRYVNDADVSSPTGGGGIEAEGLGPAAGIVLGRRNGFHASGGFSLMFYDMDLSSDSRACSRRTPKGTFTPWTSRPGTASDWAGTPRSPRLRE